MAPKVMHMLAVVLLAALLAVPLASAANSTQTVGPTKQELRALKLRGDALNRIDHLGPYARTTGSSFHWGDAGIGSAATLGTILLGLAAAAAVRRRRTAPAA
jgi:hypothetical protein